MKLLKTLPFLAAAVLAWGCGGKDNPDTPETPAAPMAISLDAESLSIPQEGGTFTLTVTSPSRPSVSARPDWVKVQDGTYQNYRLTYNLVFQPFGNYGTRCGEIVVKAGSLTKTVSITQQGRVKPEVKDPDLDTDLVTSEATSEVQALYDYLLSLYGSKILSSVMADVAWNNDVSANVYLKAGKYPAVNCYDFIHIHRSGENWIDYDDLTPVNNWVEAGGIVSLMWHFNVPTTAAAPGPVGDVTVTPSKTTFKASNVLVEGTWEQVWFDYYVDKVAGIILKLQDAGIPAIWRPFHEAAGNYYATTWNGSAWFWWGADGPEVFKGLWNRLQDAFWAKGIRNLIWVWTAQNYNGDMGSYNADEAYYPGDSRVDVVARDLYGGSAEDCALEFAQLQNTYNHKMISLGECGWGGSPSNPIATIPEQWEAGAAWSWFMVWCYDNKSYMVSDDWWRAAFKNDAVITRDKVNY